MSGGSLQVPVGHPPVVFCTPGNLDLCEKVVGHLSWKIGKAKFRTFANGEISVRLEQPVANHDVFVICSRDDLESEINFMVMQLLMMLDAMKAEAPYRITVVLPSVEYARQDKKFEAGEAIAPKLLLHLMVTAGADRFVTIDLHNQAECGFCPAHTPLDELAGVKYLANFIRDHIPDITQEETFVCAMDAGAAKRTRAMADELQVGFMMADTFRTKVGEEAKVRIISDTASSKRNIIMYDDMFDSCGSLFNVAKAVHAQVPQAKLYAVASHGFFSKDAHQLIHEMVQTLGLEWVAVTNSISPRLPQQNMASQGSGDRLKIVDISRLLAGAIIRIHLGVSVNLPKFRKLGPTNPDSLLSEAAFVPTSQYTLKAAGCIVPRNDVDL